MGKQLLGILELNRIYQTDCIEGMWMIPDNSVDLIVIDPPYNIGKDKRWDKWKTVDAYIDWMTMVFKECERVLKYNGSFYWFHNDMLQIRKLMDALDSNTDFLFKQFIVWDKFNGTPWNQLKAITHSEDNRNFPKLAEYCLFYTFQGELTDITHDVNKFITLRSYFADFLSALGLTKKALMEIVGQRADHCFRSNSTQWELPTAETYEALSLLERDSAFNYQPYESLRNEYELFREYYEKERYTFNVQKTHSSVWQYAIPSQNGHVTPKPVELIKNIIRHSTNEGDVVLDCFMGSGTTAVAAVRTGRNFIGFEREPEYIEIANKRLDNELEAR
jgi:DNA modification methylase